MKKLIFSTNDHYTGLVLRLTIASVIFVHGSQKMLGWFGGGGYTETINSITGYFHLPYIIALLVIIIEFFGALFLITGFASRIAAAAMIILFTGILFTAHFQNGFFMNWYGIQKGEGYEFDLLVIGLCIATLINGSGKYSVDSLVSKQ